MNTIIQTDASFDIDVIRMKNVCYELSNQGVDSFDMDLIAIMRILNTHDGRYALKVMDALVDQKVIQRTIHSNRKYEMPDFHLVKHENVFLLYKLFQDDNILAVQNFGEELEQAQAYDVKLLRLQKLIEDQKNYVRVDDIYKAFDPNLNSQDDPRHASYARWQLEELYVEGFITGGVTKAVIHAENDDPRYYLEMTDYGRDHCKKLRKFNYFNSMVK